MKTAEEYTVEVEEKIQGRLAEILLEMKLLKEEYDNLIQAIE